MACAVLECSGPRIAQPPDRPETNMTRETSVRKGTEVLATPPTRAYSSFVKSRLSLVPRELLVAVVPSNMYSALRLFVHSSSFPPLRPLFLALLRRHDSSIAPDSNECGSIMFFCPKGSGQRTPVSSGYYTINVPPQGSPTSLADTEHSAAAARVR